MFFLEAEFWTSSLYLGMVSIWLCYSLGWILRVTYDKFVIEAKRGVTTRLWVPNGENGVLVEPSCWLRLRGDNGLKKYKSKKMILLPSIYAGCITMGLVTLSIFLEFLFFLGQRIGFCLLVVTLNVYHRFNMESES